MRARTAREFHSPAMRMVRFARNFAVALPQLSRAGRLQDDMARRAAAGGAK